MGWLRFLRQRIQEGRNDSHVLGGERRELHSDTVSALQPLDDAVHVNPGQPRRLSQHQVQLGSHGKRFFGAQRKPAFAEVASFRIKQGAGHLNEGIQRNSGPGWFPWLPCHRVCLYQEGPGVDQPFECDGEMKNSKGDGQRL